MDSDVVYELMEIGLDPRSKSIRFTKNDNGCWECTSHAKRKGYTLVNRNGKRQSLHRYVYAMFKGRLFDTFVLLHKCDNPSCFNPDHLEAGTQSDNMLDMHNKGRGRLFGR